MLAGRRGDLDSHGWGPWRWTVAAVNAIAGDDDALAAKIAAERAAMMVAEEEITARREAEYRDCLETVRAIAFTEESGDLGLPLKAFGEAAQALKNQKQRLLNLPHRFAREDTGEVKHQRAALRKSGPGHMVSWRMLATPLLKAFGPNSEFGPDDPRLLSHDLLIELKIGEDLTPDQQRDEAFQRLQRHIGSYVDTDLVLDAIRNDAGGCVALVLRGRRIAPIAFPTDEAGQRLHTRLLVHEQRAADEFRGNGPVATLTEQVLARHHAWRRLLDEEVKDPVHKHKGRGQIETEIAKAHPAWARETGIRVPD